MQKISEDGKIIVSDGKITLKEKKRKKPQKDRYSNDLPATQPFFGEERVCAEWNEAPYLWSNLTSDLI